MAKATTGDWVRYYEEAEQRRLAGADDPLRRYFLRMSRRERALFTVSFLSLALLVSAFWAVLIR